MAVACIAASLVGHAPDRNLDRRLIAAGDGG
jgi:hypothetical protein